jgi:hypothetical protein
MEPVVNRRVYHQRTYTEVAEEEARILRALIERKTPRPIDIARAGGLSKQYVGAVLAGRRRASPKFIEACRELGLPVDVIWGGME